MQLLELVQYWCRCVYLQLNILPYIIFIAIGYLFINMFDSWATWKLTVGWDPKLMQQYERQWLNKICLFCNVLLLFVKLRHIGLLKSIPCCLILSFVVKHTLLFNQTMLAFIRVVLSNCHPVVLLRTRQFISPLTPNLSTCLFLDGRPSYHPCTLW